MSFLQTLMPSGLGDVSFINTFLSSLGTTLGVGLVTIPALLQNGNTSLGLLPVPVLPDFLGGPGQTGAPWGDRMANDTNYYQDIPTTGVTRKYDFTVARATIAPDGYEKSAMLVNGQFPGPTIEADWGDWIEVTVHNAITNPEDGTAIHWHGLTQKTTQYEDGVPGISQCPIAPGSSMTYRFQADLYGTAMYHSHYSAQITDGVFGAIVIHGPKNAEYDIDLGPIIVTDYYHASSEEVIKQVMSTNIIESATTFADGTLIQGKMQSDCSKVTDGTPCSNVELAKFQFEPGKTHRLRFINPSSFGVMVVSIDDHDMTVIANDFVPIVPYSTKVLTLAAGQRTDVLVTAKSSIQGNGAYWLRVRQPILCSLAYQPFALAAIYYNGTDKNLTPASLPQLDWITPRLLNCGNDDLSVTEPFYSITPSEPDITIKVDITSSINATGQTLYFMNGKTFRANYNEPAILAAQAGNISELVTAEDKNIYNFGNNQTIRIIFENNLPFSHPMHIHGQNMFVLDEGVGSWDGKTIVRPQNPHRRDTQILQPAGYLVAQLESDNPGIWPFHCHFAWHVSQGLIINVVQKPDEIVGLTNLPAQLADTCAAWKDWTDSHIVNQIDSGVKRLRFRNARD